VGAVRVREFPFIAVMHGRAALPKPEFSKGAPHLDKIDLFESFSLTCHKRKSPATIAGLFPNELRFGSISPKT
jgi:hypothetical protein